jgi:hypothetical protein
MGGLHCAAASTKTVVFSPDHRETTRHVAIKQYNQYISLLLPVVVDTAKFIRQGYQEHPANASLMFSSVVSSFKTCEFSSQSFKRFELGTIDISPDLLQTRCHIPRVNPGNSRSVRRWYHHAANLVRPLTSTVMAGTNVESMPPQTEQSA